MNFFEQELRRFIGKETVFKSNKPVYSGSPCFIPLSGNRRAHLEFYLLIIDKALFDFEYSIRCIQRMNRISNPNKSYCKIHITAPFRIILIR